MVCRCHDLCVLVYESVSWSMGLYAVVYGCICVCVGGWVCLVMYGSVRAYVCMCGMTIINWLSVM